MDILKDLNPEQRKAVTHGDGPLLIVAGAGTGKTTVITRRIVWLIENKKAKPEELLALTFTDKAANEMEERIDQLLPYGYTDFWVSTFHAFCERILKQHAIDIGLPGDFKLLNQTEAWLLVRQNLDKFDLDYYQPLGNPTKFIHALIKHFSRCKDERVEPKDYIEYAENIKLDSDNKELVKQETRRLNEVANAFHVYQQLLLENNALDFGDLINYTLKLFCERPAILEKYQQQFKYILVDEFQDTNWAQYELIKLLAAPRNNLTVVGDDSQSIYAFRGAAMSNILHFKNDYPKATEVTIIQNYRSSQDILDLAYKFIKQNDPNTLEFKLGISKELKAEKKYDGIIEHIHEKTLNDEVQKVAEQIVKVKKQDKEASYNDFAILIRANHQAEPFMAVFDQAGIPYQFLASAGLFTKPVILNLIAYLRLLDNYHESSAMYRVLDMPILDIPYQDLVELNFWSRRRNWSLYETLRNAAVIKKLSAETQKKSSEILRLVERHTSLAREKPVSELIFAFFKDFHYLEWLKQRAQSADPVTMQKGVEELSYLNQFFRRVQQFEQANLADRSVKNFIQTLNWALESGEEGSLQSAADEGPEAVKILTVHGAKGLEFDYVFIVNLVDLRFPSMERRDAIVLPDPLVKEILPEGDVHLQEERRLFYVAMTRARKGLFFTSAEDYGGMRRKKLSRFLTEMGYGQSKGVESTGKVDFSKKIEANSRQSPVGLAPEHAIAVPKHFSFTQLAAYNTCPLQYKFGFVLRIPVKGKAPLVFGRTMHEVMRKFFEQAVDAGSHQQKDLFGEQTVKKAPSHTLPTLDELLEIYNKTWINDWFDSKEQHDKFKKEGEKSLRELYKQIKVNPPKVKYIEKNFMAKIDGIVVKGKIDRVDETPEGLEIIDYKTGSPKEAEKLLFENKCQLFIYQIAVEDFHILGEKVAKLCYYYFTDNSKVEFLALDKEKEKTKKWITQIVEKIKTGAFAPKPGRHCEFCDFNDICEFRQA